MKLLEHGDWLEDGIDGDRPSSPSLLRPHRLLVGSSARLLVCLVAGQLGSHLVGPKGRARPGSLPKESGWQRIRPNDLQVAIPGGLEDGADYQVVLRSVLSTPYLVSDKQLAAAGPENYIKLYEEF